MKFVSDSEMFFPGTYLYRKYEDRQVGKHFRAEKMQGAGISHNECLRTYYIYEY